MPFNTYSLLVFFHILGTFGFLLAHGVSLLVSLRLRKERNLERIRALLDLSSASLGLMYGSLLLILGTRIWAGFRGRWWNMGWIWAGLGLLIFIIVAMYPLASSYYINVRKAAGMRYYGMKKDQSPDPPVSEDQMAALLSSSRPYLITGVGLGGLIAILYMMVLKPF